MVTLRDRRGPKWPFMSSPAPKERLTIRELPRSERPRERLVDLGAASLSTARTAALKTHACCPNGNSVLALPIFVSPAPTSIPCGGHSPCCAKQAPAKPALPAFSQLYRPGLEGTPVWTNETSSHDRTGAAVTSSDGLSPSLFLHTTVLRI